MTGRDIGSALHQLAFDGLALKSVRVVTTADDLADTAWAAWIVPQAPPLCAASSSR
jgi:hypothetical protein